MRLARAKRQLAGSPGGPYARADFVYENFRRSEGAQVISHEVRTEVVPVITFSVTVDCCQIGMRTDSVSFENDNVLHHL